VTHNNSPPSPATAHPCAAPQHSKTGRPTCSTLPRDSSSCSYNASHALCVQMRACAVGNSGSVSCRQVVISAHATHARRTPHKQQQPPLQSADKHIAGKAALLSAPASCMATCTVRQSNRSKRTHARLRSHAHSANATLTGTVHGSQHSTQPSRIAQALSNGQTQSLNRPARPGTEAAAQQLHAWLLVWYKTLRSCVTRPATLHTAPCRWAQPARPCLHAGACLPLQTHATASAARASHAAFAAGDGLTHT
jgi:hypothetical protein